MFIIQNSAGSNIATVTHDQLIKMRQEGILKPSDKIIDLSTGKIAK